MEDKLLYRDEVYAIQGALFDVYKTMGNMWGEEVYQQCLEKELSLRNIPFEAKKELPIFYKGEKIEKKYIVDHAKPNFSKPQRDDSGCLS